MIPVKIECGCGQHYAFDVEPINGRMAAAVTCPVCGADGTTATNELIAQHLAETSPPIERQTNRSSLSIAKAEPATNPPPRIGSLPKGSPHASQLGLVSREQAEIEARAKISWGDSPEDVTKYLMLQGFTYQEASDLVQEMFLERTAATRVNGVRKIIIGIGLICVPIITYLIFAYFGVIFLKIMAIAVMVGVWGAWNLINGILMILVPKMEKGDLAEQ